MGLLNGELNLLMRNLGIEDGGAPEDYINVKAKGKGGDDAQLL